MYIATLRERLRIFCACITAAKSDSVSDTIEQYKTYVDAWERLADEEEPEINARFAKKREQEDAHAFSMLTRLGGGASLGNNAWLGGEE